jgi:hypothetical protein
LRSAAVLRCRAWSVRQIRNMGWRAFFGSEQESVRPPCFVAFSVFWYSRGALLQDAWEGLSPAFMGRSVGIWTMIAVCAASSGCRAPAGRSAALPISIAPGSFRCESGALSANECRRQSAQGKLARKKRRQSFLESVFYVPSEKALASPPHALATPGDSAMPDSCPSRHQPTAKGSG